MLISEKVKTRINSSNIKLLKLHYENIKIGDIKEISVKHLSKSSHVLVDVCCDVCFNKKTMIFRQYTNSISNGDYYACSQKCSKNKGKETNLKKYGVENPSQSKEIKEKIKKTNLKKYGVINVYQSEKIKEKIKEINLKKYGVENVFQNQEIKDKIKETNLEKYGVENVFQNEEIKDKIKKINLKKYGVEYINQSNIIRQKTKNTCLIKYGTEYANQNYNVKNKIKITNLKRYGVENVYQSEEIKKKIRQTNLNKYGVEYPCQNNDIYQKQIKSGYKIKMHPCGLFYQGTYEKEFIDFCIKNDIIIIKPPIFNYKLKNKNKKYFPDFYCSELNLIIEIKSKYYYNLHLIKNEAKKQSVLKNNYNYILIMDKDYNEFIKTIQDVSKTARYSSTARSTTTKSTKSTST